MSVLNLRVDTGDTDLFAVSGKSIQTAQNFELLFKSLAGGARTKPATVRADVTPVAASGTLTLSSASGTVGGVINGVTVTVTASGGDTTTAAAVAAAINASSDALISGLVTATSALGVVTVTTAVTGKMGNAVTLAASGTGVTASGARLTNGSDGTTNSYVY